MSQVAIVTSDLQMSQQLKTKLLQQCKDTVGNDLDGRRPLHIAVIGPPGCGKSSFLNTIFASFKNNDGTCWRETAKTGNYGEHDIQVTSRLRIKDQRKKSSFNNFLLLVIVFIFYYFPFDSFVSNRTLYQLGPPFCWTSEHIGWYGAGEDIELFIIAISILKIAHMFTNDANMALVGLVSSAACFGLFGLTNSDWMIYGVTAVGLFRILPIPLLKAMMSRIVQPDQQGVLFSNISVITALCAVVGSTVFNNIYYETRPIYKGLVFMVMAGSQLIGTILMIFTICRKSSKHQKDLATKEPEIQATDQ